MSGYSLNILHLYPDLLNLYGDKGNLASLTHRLTWRGMDASVTVCNQEDTPDFSDCDIVFLGGGADKEQESVCELLADKAEALKTYVENDGVMLATCGGFEMLGTLGVLDIQTETAEKRLISDVILQSDLIDTPICGFENHSGRINIGNYTPLGKVLFGNGNNGTDGTEGLVYRNLIATYLHGPLLPKNPQLCDWLLLRALKKKYPNFEALTPLDNSMESAANQYICRTFLKK